MSGKALIWAAEVKGLKPATKIVLIQLAQRASKEDNRCFPSAQLLAADCEMDRATVFRHLKTLEERGLITRKSRGDGKGGRSSNVYTLHIDLVFGPSSYHKETSQNATRVESHQCDGGGGPVATGVVVPVRHEPYNEPYNEPPNTPKGAVSLFPDLPDQDATDPELAAIELGFKEWWSEIWPSHPRKAGRAACHDLYRKTCLGKFKKAEKISPTTLNRATRAYIASVKDMQYLKAPKAWLNVPGWEPFLETDPEAELTDAQKRYRAAAERAREV